MRPRRYGFTLIELLIVLVLVGILAAVAHSFLWKAKDRALVSTMKTDLKNLATHQEAYFGKNLIYAADPATIFDFHSSPSVVITINYAQTDGWAGVATHASVVGKQCGLFMGNALPAAAPPATRPGIAECD